MDADEDAMTTTKMNTDHMPLEMCLHPGEDDAVEMVDAVYVNADDDDKVNDDKADISELARKLKSTGTTMN